MKISSSDRAALLRLIARFSGQHIVVLGDLVADEYIYGEIARVSREAPVLILKQRERQIVPGGAGNAANNLASLGARVTPVGAVGRDQPGDALLRYFRERDISTRAIIRVAGYRTPTKTRILGGHTHWQRQQIVRLDNEPAGPLPHADRKRLTAATAAALGSASGVVISDYGYGSTGPAEVARLARRGSRKSPSITLDSRFALLSYTRVTAATPNEPELEEAFGERVGQDVEMLHRLGRRALRRMGLEALVVTRGRDGMALFEPGRSPVHLAIFGTDQVSDVTGAGDTVVVAFALSRAAGATFLQAAQIANCAAGLVVMKRGTATVSARELEEALGNA